MDEATKPLLLNLGCGLNPQEGYCNVDLYGDPDVRHDLNVTPYPWSDNSVDHILMSHVLEHVQNWWGSFTECARILKPGGTLEIRVPDESSMTALTYRDHLHVFSTVSFHGIRGANQGTNAWAVKERDTVPLTMDGHMLTPHKEYMWMAKWCPWLLRFCARHLRNFIWEQRFYFRKIGSPAIGR